MPETEQDQRRIAVVVVGAPGAEKHEVAYEFGRMLEESSLLQGAVTVLPSPVKWFTETVDRSAGPLANYDLNLMLATDQLQDELMARRDLSNVIVVGGILQRLAHSAVRAQSIHTGVKTPDSDAMLVRESQTTTMLSFLLVDSMNYTFFFYLPLPEEILIPGQETDNSYNQQIDAALRQAMQSFRIPALVLDPGTPTQRAETMMGILRTGIETATSMEQHEDDQAEENDTKGTAGADGDTGDSGDESLASADGGAVPAGTTER